MSESPPATSSAPLAEPVREQCSAYDAARVLGISDEEVLELCVAGALDAQQVRGQYWLIDEDSLTRYLDANPSQPEDAPCPPGACEAHFARRGKLIPEFRLGLCQRCFSGKALPMKMPDGSLSG